MKDFKTFGFDVGQGKYHEEILYSMALIYNIVNQSIATYLRDYDLTLGKLNILLVIKHQGQEEGIRQVEISKHLIVTPSNMTKMLDKLEKDGYVTRSALEGDRRVNIIKITNNGVELLDSLWEGYNEKLKEILKPLKQEKQKQLATLLTAWFNQIK